MPTLTKDNSMCRAGKEQIYRFYERYKMTKQVDVVFVLDRSGSVTRKGWISSLNFVRDLLEHFTVDKDNTRVAIVTFSTNTTIDVNDLHPSFYSDRQNKCTLNWRINNYIERQKPCGHTDTHKALVQARAVLKESRPNAKKLVFVLTDGPSNVTGITPKAASNIVSLKFNKTWNENKLGHQCPIRDELDEFLTKREVVQAIASTENNKAARLDGIPADVYKHDGDTLVANRFDRYRCYW
ncbi:Sushi, von Willebrand factor type A, EGF and pentraxin domain-containing protein 1 [Lamellibrachia satsuma]|nr:Sushi, von Willebrand factor type A, EGF and pentraxin domain-containing protein 1 [Lamellibrachia satsuma]